MVDIEWKISSVEVPRLREMYQQDLNLFQNNLQNLSFYSRVKNTLTYNRLSFKTQLKIEFLQLYTGNEKMLESVPAEWSF